MFGMIPETGVPLLKLDCDKVGSGVKFTTIGADDEMANTLFVLKVDGEREETRRPEPMLVTYLDMLLMAEEYTIQFVDGTTKNVQFKEKELHGIKETKAEVKAGLENAPLG